MKQNNKTALDVAQALQTRHFRLLRDNKNANKPVPSEFIRCRKNADSAIEHVQYPEKFGDTPKDIEANLIGAINFGLRAIGLQPFATESVLSDTEKLAQLEAMLYAN